MFSDEPMTMKDFVEILFSTLTMIGGIITAYIAYTREHQKERELKEEELEKARREQRIRVYTDYLQIISEADQTLIRFSAEAELDILKKYAEGEREDGKDWDQYVERRRNVASALVWANNLSAFGRVHANLVTYGSPSVIACLSAYYDSVEKNGMNPFAPDINRAFLELIKAMRSDSWAQDYDEFVAHADNIMGAKSEERKIALRERQKALLERQADA